MEGAVKTLNSLIVNLEDIPPEGLALTLNVSAADMAEILEGGEETPTILSPLTGALRLRAKEWNRLIIKGAFKVTVIVICDRCLADTPTELSYEVNETLDLITPGAPENADSDSDGDLEATDGKVDLSGLLGELFWLAWPDHFICRPDCAGLCPRCGADLNEGLCACVDGCGKS